MESKTDAVEEEEECFRVEKEVNVENLNEVAFVTNNGSTNLSCVLSQSIETEFESPNATVETELETVQGTGTIQSHEESEPHNISFVVDHFCRYQALQDQPDPLAVEQDYANLHSQRGETMKPKEVKDDDIFKNEVVEKGLGALPESTVTDQGEDVMCETTQLNESKLDETDSLLGVNLMLAKTTLEISASSKVEESQSGIDPSHIPVTSSKVPSPEISRINFEAECDPQIPTLGVQENSSVQLDGEANMEIDIFQCTETSLKLAKEDDCNLMEDSLVTPAEKSVRIPAPIILTESPILQPVVIEDETKTIEDSTKSVGEKLFSVEVKLADESIQEPGQEILVELPEAQRVVDETITVISQFEKKSNEDASCERNANDQTKGYESHENDKSLVRLGLLNQRAIDSRDAVLKDLAENFQYVKKTLEDYLAKEAVLAQECIENCNEITAYMTSTVTQLPETLKATCLDHLEACFSAGQWLEQSLKQKRVVEYKEALQDHYELKYNGKFTIKNVCDRFKLGNSYKSSSGLRAPEPTTICDPFLVNVTWVNDPGEFYIVRECDKKIREMIISTLKQAASSYAMPQEIVYGQIYAVRNSGENWFRGICGKRCGISSIGDNPPEALYEFFFLDQGHHECIGSSNIRVLPPEILSYPALARECTLNQNFQRVPWSAQATNYFKQMTRRGPLNMKVFSQEADVLNVDLAQLPCFAEEGNIVSVRDALLFSHSTPTITTDLTQLQFKPKFPFPAFGAPELPKHYLVRVVCAVTPTLIYVQILDDEFSNFERFEEELRTELENTATDPNACIQNARRGVVCAIKFKNRWCRALVEDVHRELVEVFYVDTGHRQKIPLSSCFKLPEKFMDYPAQAVKCFLDGIAQRDFPSGNKFNRKKWPREVVDRLYKLVKKPGVIFIESRTFGEVGRLHATPELTLSVVLYMDGDHNCVNTSIGRTGFAISTKRHEKPEHSAIRCTLMQRKMSRTENVFAQEPNSFIPASSIGGEHKAMSTGTSSFGGSPTPDSFAPIKELRSRLNSSASMQSEKEFNLSFGACREGDNDRDQKRQISNDDNSLYSDGVVSSNFGKDTPTSSFVNTSAEASNICSSFAPPSSFTARDTCATNLAVRGNPEGTASGVILLREQRPSVGVSSLLNVGDNSSGSNLDCKNLRCHPWENYAFSNPLIMEPAPRDIFATPLDQRTDRDRLTLIKHDDLESMKTFPPAEEQSLHVKENQHTKSYADPVGEKYDGNSGADADVVSTQGTQANFNETASVVFFSWCDSPDALYFRTSEMRDLFRTMKSEMQTYYKCASKKPRKELNFEVGFHCAVYTDTKWWRAEVTCMDNYPECDVLLVDTGYQRTVQVQDIYPLAPHFDEHPRLTRQCSLFGVYPPDGSVWDDSVSKYISERLLGAEGISIFRRGNEKSKYASMPVMLLYIYDVEGGPLEIGGRTRINLNEELILLELASNRPSILPAPIPVRRACAWKSGELPKLEDVFWGQVTWVDLEGGIYLHDIKANPKIEEIRKWLDDTYNGTQPTDSDLNCSVGDLCIARYRIDNSWHRAIVSKIDDNPEEVTVIFVDYGTLDAVDRRNIRLNIMLEELPIQAIRCVLHNVRPPPSSGAVETPKWPVATLNRLHVMIVEKEFRVRVKGRGPPLEVALTADRSESIAKILVTKEKLAVYIQPIKKKKYQKKKNVGRV